MRAIIILTILQGCTIIDCPANLYANITAFDINFDAITQSGIKIDTNNNMVDLGKLDERIDLIESCILKKSVTILPSWQCIRESQQPLNRDCLGIKIVEPIYSKCSSWQFIGARDSTGQLVGIPAQNELCEEKGLLPTAECPCLWRTTIQNDWTIITPPAMYLWEIGRVMTSCNNIWHSDFAECLSF